MHKWKRDSFCTLIAVSMCLGCGSRRNAAGEAEGNDGKPKVVVITRQSAFKDTLVARLSDDYGTRTHLTVMDISTLNDIDEDDFDAIVVMGARMGFLLFSAKERRFLRKLDHPDKLVLLMTCAIPDWKWDREDIDVISGASSAENLDPFYKEIHLRLDTILSRQ